MCKRYFVLCRNTIYAKIIAESLNGFVRNNKSELLGVTPNDNDVFIVDAHIDGLMSQMNGIELVSRLINSNSDSKHKMNIYSWFAEDYIKSNYRFPNIFRNGNVIFKQLPIKLSEFQQ